VGRKMGFPSDIAIFNFNFGNGLFRMTITSLLVQSKIDAKAVRVRPYK
jgi:hypothetical protein